MFEQTSRTITGVVAFSAVAVSIACLAGCMHPYRQTIDAYRAAKKVGDYKTASSYMADDARIWFGEKEGPGNALTAKGGPYRNWDKEFHSTSTKKNYETGDHTLSYTSFEINDYYRMIDRTPTPARVTYYFNDDGKITGMLYRGLNPGKQRPPDRRCEFDRWVEKKYPGLIESEEMNIPNNPRRWRELLVEWRADVGLPAIE